jgi:hypothetical protein
MSVQTNGGIVGDSVLADNMSIQQLPDLACLLTNFATTDWNRYTQQRNIQHDAGVIDEAWVGVSNVTIALGVWIDNGDGSYSLVGDGTAQPLGIYNGSAVPLLIKVLVEILTGGTLRVDDGAAFTEIFIGNNTVIETPVSATINIVRLSGSITTTIKNISVRHLLEVA